ncbi:ketosteroid isomerase-like protein [Sphingomonas zeicaulis]|uniref:nuclear transport factor 2 family protein n=1 Tax=Sphingomonas zeicaulis TaxID=1632740 RepID=UPI003D1923D2
MTVELFEPALILERNLAVVFGLSRMRGDKKGQGPLDAWNRRTIVLRRDDGAWHIVHEHKSCPMEMDGSGRAATDLRPEGESQPPAQHMR